KYRDEPRARFGVIRGREFLMMDAYSFDASKAEMIASYDALCEAYRRIFTRLGLDATPVEAVAGAIGGDVNHEWMVPSPIGEDHFARCTGCGYAANTERAEAGRRDTAGRGGGAPRSGGGPEAREAAPKAVPMYNEP